MDKKKSGLAGLRETLKIDKIMDKISEVVDGKSNFKDIDKDDVIANRIKDIHSTVDAARKIHQEQAKVFSTLSGLLKKLHEDVIQLREASSVIQPSTSSSAGTPNTAGATGAAPASAHHTETVSPTRASESVEPENVTSAEPTSASTQTAETNAVSTDEGAVSSEDAVSSDEKNSTN